MTRPDDSLQFLIEMRDIYVNIATGIILFWPGQWMDDPWFGPSQVQRIYSPKHPDKLWELQNLLFSYYIWECSCPCEKLGTQLHLVPRLTMSEDTPPPLYIPPWHAQGHLYHILGSTKYCKKLLAHFYVKYIFSKHGQQSTKRFLFIMLIKRSQFRIRHRTECVCAVTQ